MTTEKSWGPMTRVFVLLLGCLIGGLMLTFALCAGIIQVKADRRLDKPSIIEHTYTDTGIKLIIENPLQSKVSIELACGSTLENPLVLMYPNTREEFLVSSNSPKDLHACMIYDWKKVK